LEENLHMGRGFRAQLRNRNQFLINSDIQRLQHPRLKCLDITLAERILQPADLPEPKPLGHPPPKGIKGETLDGFPTAVHFYQTLHQ
jgi:hypothetical protein